MRRFTPQDRWFSVIIATHNRESYLRRALASLRQQVLTNTDWEVIVADNASTDGTAALVEKLRVDWPELRYLFLDRANTSRARNWAAQYARGRWLVFTDDDCLLPPGWLQRAVRVAGQDQVRIFGGPAIQTPDGPVPEWFQRDYESHDLGSASRWLRSSEYLIECNFFIEAEFFKTIGGFREELGPGQARFGYHEGTELQQRARSAPLQAGSYYEPELSVQHLLRPEKCRIRHRIYRQIIAGYDHVRVHRGKGAHPCWMIPVDGVRLLWRSWRILWSILFEVPSRNRTRHPEWRQFFYERISRKIYLLGETLGDLAEELHWPHRATWSQGKMTLRSRLRLPLLRLYRWMQVRAGKEWTPTRIELDTPAWARESPDHGTCRVVSEGELIPNRPSYPQLGSIHPRLCVSEPELSPRTWVAEISGGKVYGPSVAVVTRDNRFLADVSVEWVKSPEDHGLMRRFSLPNALRLPGRSLLLASTGGDTFYHWNFDVLPRMDLALRAGFQVLDFDHIIVNSLEFAFQRQGLQACGIRLDRCRTLEASVLYEAETLVVPSLPGSSGHPTPSSCQFLRKTFGTGRPARPKRKILLGRRGTKGRTAIHWDKLVGLLGRMGFEEIEPSRMNVQDQASLFAESEWIVALHGAALANLVHCSSSTRVVEIFSWGYVNPCYFSLCNAMEIRHASVICGAPSDGSVNLDLSDAGQAIELRPELVLEALEQLGLSSGSGRSSGRLAGAVS